MVRAIFYAALNIPVGHAGENLVAAPSDLVDAFANGTESVDPLATDDVLLDYSDKWRQSPWNQHIISSLAAVLIESGRSAELPSVSVEYLEASLVRSMETVKSYWNGTKPRVNRQGQLETPEDVEARLVQSAAERENRSLRYHHRQEVRSLALFSDLCANSSLEIQ